MRAALALVLIFAAASALAEEPPKIDWKPAFAGAPPPANRPVKPEGLPVIASADKKQIKVGEPVVVRLHVKHPRVEGAPQSVYLPDGLRLGAFELLSREDVPTEDGTDVLLTLTTFALGERMVPPITAGVGDAQGQSEALMVEVLSVLPPDVQAAMDEMAARLGDKSILPTLPPKPEGDLAPEAITPAPDARAPEANVDVMEPFFAPLWGLLVLAVLSPIVYAVWLLRRRRRPEVVVAGPPPRPAHEVALAKLKVIEDEQLVAKERVKEFYVRVSEVMREYLGSRYGAGVLDMTTSEIREWLEGRMPQGLDARGMLTWLTEADLVKFAKHQPLRHDIDGFRDRAYSIIDDTRERPAESPTAGEKAA